MQLSGHFAPHRGARVAAAGRGSAVVARSASDGPQSAPEAIKQVASTSSSASSSSLYKIAEASAAPSGAAPFAMLQPNALPIAAAAAGLGLGAIAVSKSLSQGGRAGRMDSQHHHSLVPGGVEEECMDARLTPLAPLSPGSRRYTGNVGKEYDEWTEEGILEYYVSDPRVEGRHVAEERRGAEEPT